jgi:hypothetical protein
LRLGVWNSLRDAALTGRARSAGGTPPPTGGRSAGARHLPTVVGLDVGRPGTRRQGWRVDLREAAVGRARRCHLHRRCHHRASSWWRPRRRPGRRVAVIDHLIGVPASRARAATAGTELAAALTRSRRSKVGRDQSLRGSTNRGVWLEPGESRPLRAVLADLRSPRLVTVGHGVRAGEPPPKCDIGFAYPSTSPNSSEVVRGGIEPPTPRFSGAPNGSILPNSGDLSALGVRLDPWCGHDRSRLVTPSVCHGGSLCRVCDGCTPVTAGCRRHYFLPRSVSVAGRSFGRRGGSWRFGDVGDRGHVATGAGGVVAA